VLLVGAQQIDGNLRPENCLVVVAALYLDVIHIAVV
jgi:hypothetical protein